MKVKITKIRDTALLPQYHSAQAAGFDLSAAEAVSVAPRQVAKVPTGLVFQCPEGYFLLVTARSSLALKKGLMLANGVGVLDRDYAGPTDELCLLVHNFTDKTVEVAVGERLAQGMFLPVEQTAWEEQSEITEPSRGGMGSTGGYA